MTEKNHSSIVQTSMSERETPRRISSAISEGKMTRRRFLQGALVGASMLLPDTMLPHTTTAEDTPTDEQVLNLDLLFKGEINRPEDMKYFLQTRLLPPDERLAKRSQTPITGLTLNPDKEIFENLEGYKSPKNRLDKAVLKAIALLESVRGDTEAMTDMKIETVNDRLASPVGQRETTGAYLPEPVPEERILELMSDPEYRLPIMGYPEGEFDPDKYKRFDIDPHLGIEIEILDDRPEHKPKVGIFGSYGFTPTVVEHAVRHQNKTEQRYGLRIGLFANDTRFIGSDFFDPQGEADALYSMLLNQYIERISFITPPLMTYYSSVNEQNPYWTKLMQSPGFVYYPEIATLTNGPHSADNRHTTAPVLHIVSPTL